MEDEDLEEESMVALESLALQESPAKQESPAAALKYPSPSKMAASSPVIQEENPGKGFLLALVGLAVVVLILYLLFFA